MKKKAKLVLSKETLRTLTQEKLREVDGKAAAPTTGHASYDPRCFYSEDTYCVCG